MDQRPDISEDTYKPPRAVRSHSFNVPRPSPPLPIQSCRPRQEARHTVYTQNQVYGLQLPGSAPPSLPPRNYSTLPGAAAVSALAPPLAGRTAQDKPCSSASGSSLKRRWSYSLKNRPHFGSFKLEKSKKTAVPQPDQPTDKVVVSQPLPGSTFTLLDLAENQTHSFPLQVRVLQQSSHQQAVQSTVCESEVYNLLLVKQQQSVCMEDILGTSYSIPLNSAVQFGYINATDRRTNPHSLEYKSYTSVADLLCLNEHQMPRVVCSQVAHRGQSGKCSVEDGEVLLVLQAQKNKLSSRKHLKVFSFTTRSKKHLNHDCVGHFTTNPAHLRLWLTDIVNSPSSVLPCQAVVYLEKRFTSSLKSFPSTLLQADSFVTLTELQSHTSIIASLVSPQHQTDPSSPHSAPPYSTQPLYQPTLLDLPLSGPLSSLQIELQTPYDTAALHSTARSLYEDLLPSSLHSLDDGGTNGTYHMQRVFNAVLRRGSELVGVDLLKPSSAYHDMPPETVTASKVPVTLEPDSDCNNEHYEKISDWLAPDLAPPLADACSPSSLSSGFHSLPRVLAAASSSVPYSPSPQQPTTYAEEEYELVDTDLHLPPPPHEQDDLDCDLTDLHTAVRMLEERIVPLEQRVAHHQHLQALVRALSARVATLERQLQPPSQRHTSTATSHVGKGANRTYLCSLSQSQVLEVLDALSLSQYKPVFHYMGMSGKQLSCYSGAMLESCLGVTQPVDRERLLLLINGSISAHELLYNS